MPFPQYYKRFTYYTRNLTGTFFLFNNFRKTSIYLKNVRATKKKTLKTGSLFCYKVLDPLVSLFYQLKLEFIPFKPTFVKRFNLFSYYTSQNLYYFNSSCDYLGDFKYLFNLILLVARIS